MKFREVIKILEDKGGSKRLSEALTINTRILGDRERLPFPVTEAI